MKFIVNSSTLLKELQKLNGVISTSNTLPILDNFLFEIEDGKIKIIASDLETTMISEITTESSSNGQITIPSKILIAKSLLLSFFLSLIRAVFSCPT